MRRDPLGADVDVDAAEVVVCGGLVNRWQGRLRMRESRGTICRDGVVATGYLMQLARSSRCKEVNQRECSLKCTQACRCEEGFGGVKKRWGRAPSVRADVSFASKPQHSEYQSTPDIATVRRCRNLCLGVWKKIWFEVVGGEMPTGVLETQGGGQ